MPEEEYLEEVKRLKNQTLALCVQTEALREEQQPESLRRDLDLNQLLGQLVGEVDAAWTTAERALKHTEIILAMQGHPLDSRDQYERDAY